MAATAEPVIEIDTATVAPPVGRAAWVRVGGSPFEARCPKDALLVSIYQEQSKDLAVVRRFLAAMFGTTASAEIETMLDSPDYPDVTYVTLYKVVQYLMSDPAGPQWSEAITESMKQLGSGKTPTTQRVAAKPAAARKTAAKKTARKPAARR